ncbi:PREDICTED: glucagon receptor-like isoform X2 [Nicrophorus vespilloides]|uniref:Glucagon receptor-like isoform X2 n=1 Tax=Nicrophorus vespilloides TaxID=110193 RepID=A0ABM1MW09_NICVS|nr:PREDICTED: glucagon receptor-like isoform X2 [Nicrophorus vespilloides]
MAKYSMENLLEGIRLANETCLQLYGNESLSSTIQTVFNKTLGVYVCPAFFDGIMCWPPTQANSTASFSCPSYFTGFDPSQNATKECLDNGMWFVNEEGKAWTNYTKCYTSEETVVEVPIKSDIAPHFITTYLPTIKIISKTGYSVSLVTLVIAFIIMFSIKKLHCPRNKLHMHLFASFIFRAFISLLKHIIFVDGVGLHSDIILKNGQKFFFVDKKYGNWGCKLIISLFQFFITANYSWILMEGLYLHNLIFRALFADSNRKITPYIIMGWGMPAVVTSVWIVTRIMLENTLCWTTHDDKKMTFLIIRIPTAISILLNLILFVRIAVVIFSKLQAHVYEEARRYQKWARSTLVLAPLFGIHYALLIGMSSWINKDEIIESIWLISDQLFASFQGFVVAILYCFMNSEVRTELKPHVHVFLTYLATNKCLKYFFPCREKYLRSARGRTSVCTTMSCSSLFNNGVNHHRNSRTRGWEFMGRNKNVNVHDRNVDHVCRTNARSWHEGPGRWNAARCTSAGCNRDAKHYNFSSNGNIPSERSSCLEQPAKCKSETQLVSENISMLPRN